MTTCLGNSCSPGYRDDVFDGVSLSCPFSNEMPWLRSGTESVSEGLPNYSVVVVVLLFYVHGKHLRSSRDGQLT